MLKITALLVLFLLFSLVFAEEAEENVKRYPRSVDASFLMNQLAFSLSDGEGNSKVKYINNSPLRVGAGISLDYFGLSLSVGLPPEKKNENKGDSDFWSFIINYYTEQFGFDFYLQWNKGFYPEDPKSVKPSWREGDPYPVRSDLSIMTTGVNFFTVFRDDVDLKRMLSYSIFDDKWAGGWLFMSSINYMKISSSSPIIPDGIFEDNGIVGYLGGKYFSFSIAPGYYYKLSLGDFHIFAMLFAGGGIQFQDYSLKDKRESDLRGIVKVNIRWDTVYNISKSYVLGLKLFLDGNPANHGAIEFSSLSFEAKFFLMYRF